MKVCMFSPCGASIQLKRIMCRRHWSLVSPGVQKFVWNADKYYRQTGGKDIQAKKSYIAALNEAAREVAHKLEWIK